MNRNLETRNDVETIESIYEELIDCDFIHDLVEEYEEQLKKDKIVVDYLDLFGQCVVCMNFEDHFAIRDHLGVWRHANASEACDMCHGKLKGMQILSS
ncbi:MAG: hypothetical protein RSC05_13430 [Acinetobacter sp.]